MLKVEDVLKLIDKGFTRDEIVAMTESKETAEESQVETAESSEPTKKTDESYFHNTMENLMKTMTSEFKKGLEDVRKEIQMANLKDAQIDISTNKPEDILASIINPTHKEK